MPAQVVVELSGDERKLLDAFRRIQDAQDKMDKGLKATKQSHREAFGSEALQGIQSYATSVLSVTAAFGFAKRTITEMIAESDRLAQKQQESARGLGPLLQLAAVSEDPRAAMRKSLAEARRSFAEGATPTMAEAGALQFTLESAQLAQYREQVASLQASGAVANADQLVSAVNAMAISVGKDFGDLATVLNKGLGASSVAKASVEELLAATAHAVPMSRLTGIMPEDTLAAIAAMSGPAMGADPAGDLLRNLEKQIAMEAIPAGLMKPGGTIGDQVAKIRQLVESGTPIQDILGARAEAITAYGYLSEGETANIYQQARKNISQAVQNNAVELMGQLAAETPELSVPLQERRAAAGYELASERAGRRAALERSVIADVETRARQRGGGDWEVWMERWMGNMERFMWSAPWVREGEFLRQWKDAATPDTQRAIESYLREIAENTANLNGAGQQRAAQSVAE